jgi:hypothetical protein
MTPSLTTLDITIKMHHSANIMLSQAILTIMMRTPLLIHILVDYRNLAQDAECRQSKCQGDIMTFINEFTRNP